MPLEYRLGPWICPIKYDLLESEHRGDIGECVHTDGGLFKLGHLSGKCGDFEVKRVSLLSPVRNRCRLEQTRLASGASTTKRQRRHIRSKQPDIFAPVC